MEKASTLRYRGTPRAPLAPRPPDVNAQRLQWLLVAAVALNQARETLPADFGGTATGAVSQTDQALAWETGDALALVRQAIDRLAPHADQRTREVIEKHNAAELRKLAIVKHALRDSGLFDMPRLP
jgi:hypothetical protein